MTVKPPSAERLYASILLMVFLSIAASQGSQPAAFASGNADAHDVRVRAAQHLAIKTRQQKDHRVCLFEDKFDSEPCAQVCLVLSDQSTPFIITLGWFFPIQTPSEFKCIDEFGERVPLPGIKPQRRGFNEADWRSIRAFDFITESKLKQALSEYMDAVDRAPASPKLHNNIGVLLALEGKYGPAQTRFNQALKLKPDYAQALVNRAWLALLIHQPELALKDASQALTLNGDLANAKAVLARAKLETGETQDALEIAQALKGQSGDPQSLILFADSQLAKADYKGALKTYAKLLLVLPGNSNIMLKMAYASDKSGDLDTALKYAREAVQASPSDAEAHLALGRYLDANRDSKAAALQFEQVIEICSGSDAEQDRKMSLTAHGPLVRLLSQLQELEKLDRYTRRWVDEFPESADCHYNRAWVVSQLQSNKDRSLEAVGEYRKAMALDPHLGQARYNIALLLVKAGMKPEAVKELKAFVDSYPDDPDAPHAKELLAKLQK